MIFAFTLKDWQFAIKEMCRVCKAGGYVELTEKDILFWNEKIIQRVQDYGVCIHN